MGLGILLVLALLAPPASAKHGTLIRMRTTDWDIRYARLDPITSRATTASRVEDLNTTKINSRRTSGHKGSEVQVGDRVYRARWLGLYGCKDVADGKCTHGHISLNRRTYKNVAGIPSGERMNEQQIQSVMCEELGHATGLDHRPERAPSCMDSPTDNFPRHFDDHDRKTINNRY